MSHFKKIDKKLLVATLPMKIFSSLKAQTQIVKILLEVQRVKC